MDVYLFVCPPHSDGLFAALAGMRQGEPTTLPDKNICDTCPMVREGKGQVRQLRRFLPLLQYSGKAQIGMVPSSDRHFLFLKSG